MAQEETFGAHLLINIFGYLSCVSLLLIMIVFFYEFSKKKTTPAFELIFYLCLASFINTVAFMLLYIPDLNKSPIDPVLCKAQGALIFFSEFAQYTIATLISVFIFKIKSKDEFYDSFSALRRILYLSVSFGLAAVATAAGLFWDIFGQNRNKCWIKKELDGWPIFIDCFVIWVLILINFFLALMIYMKKFKAYISEEIKYRIDFSSKLSMYPVVSFICWLMTSLASYFDHEDKKFIFFDVINLISNLVEGFLYAAVSMYFFSFRKKLKKILKKLLWKKRKNYDCNLNENFFDKYSQQSDLNFDIDQDDSSMFEGCNTNRIVEDSRANLVVRDI